MADTIESFNCTRQSMTLTVSGCRRLWQSAQEKRPATWEGRHKCLTCPIGSANAGQAPAEAAADRVKEALHKFCPRCSRPASRLINGAHCVSCYNRAREMIRGKNAKGNAPIVVAARIHDVALIVSAPASAPVLEVFTAVTGRVEAMILAAKRAVGTVDFGVPLRSLMPEGAAA